MIKKSKDENKIRTLALLVSTVVSYVDTICVPYVLKSKNSVLFSNSIFSLIMFFGLLVLLNKLTHDVLLTDICKDTNNASRVCGGGRNKLIISVIYGCFFSTFQILSVWIDEEINCISSIVFGLALTYTYSLFVYKIISFLDSYEINYYSYKSNKVTKFYDKYGILFGFFLMLLMQIIIWLAVYPGYFCYDATWQLNMFETGSITQHHPVLHTLILGWSISSLYKVFDNYNKAIATYLFCQIILNTTIVSYALYILKKAGLKNRFVFLAQIWYTFFPTVAMLIQCSTKDSLFSTVFLLLIALIYSIEKESDKKIGLFEWVQLFICIFVCMLLRNNVIYAFGFFTVLLLIFRNIISNKKKVYFVAFPICIAASIIINIGFTNVGFAKGPFREAFSVPIQQISAVYNYNYSDLQNDELAFLEELNSPERWNMYDPHLSDEVRWGINDEMLKDEFTTFIRTWFSIGKRNIGLYIKSFLKLTQYAWDTSSIIDVYKNNQYYDYNTTQKSYFLAWTETPGARNSKIPLIEKCLWILSRYVSFERVPVLSMLFSVAFMNWFMLFSFIYTIHTNKKSFYCAWTILLVMILSFLMGPCVLPRYYLPVFMLFPIFISSLFQKDLG